MAGYAVRAILIAGAALMASACSTYPSEPRYSTRADGPSPAPYPGQTAYPDQANAPAMTGRPYTEVPAEPAEAPPPSTAPIGSIEGGALPSSTPSTSLPTTPAPAVSTPRASTTAGATYVIQPGDTISGVGRRFRTPVQSLIDLNELGPRAAIRPGQSIILPTSAVDVGSDPYATGPAPVGVIVTGAGAPPPPVPPLSASRPNPVPAPVTPRPTPTPPAAASSGSGLFQWPVRGEILRRFGPIGLGERNNGINIGASAGAAVVASGPGRVAYVGDALPGQGLTVLIMHRDGWRTVYGHLGSATVDDGDDVRAGQQIGTVGLTAGDGRPSIHFETRKMEGDNPTAIDPLTVLPR